MTGLQNARFVPSASGAWYLRPARSGFRFVRARSPRSRRAARPSPRAGPRPRQALAGIVCAPPRSGAAPSDGTKRAFCIIACSTRSCRAHRLRVWRAARPLGYQGALRAPWCGFFCRCGCSPLLCCRCSPFCRLCGCFRGFIIAHSRPVCQPPLAFFQPTPAARSRAERRADQSPLWLS